MIHDGIFRRSLPGGTVLAGATVPDRHSVAVGVWVRSGSRDELPGHEGAAHFVEHLVFKGSARRDAREIALSLERVGGALEAFTTKETTCFYARVLERDVALAVDVLGDLVAGPRFDPVDVDRERKVVLEELRGLDDSPEELAGDLAMAHLWPDHPLGANILGSEASLRGLDAAAVRAFHGETYRSGGMLVTAAGAVDADALVDAFADRLPVPPGTRERERVAPGPAPRTLALHERDVSQLQLALVTRAPARGDRDRPAVQLLAEILGGGMSSRLFQSIREEAGLAYSVYAYTEHFEDTGMFGIQLGVSPKRGREAVDRVTEELARLLAEGLLPGELDAAVAQVRGSLVMGQESLTNRMLRLSRVAVGEEPAAVADSLARFEAVTGDEVLAAARTLLDPAALSLVAVGPVEKTGFDRGGYARVIEEEQP